MKKNHLKKGLMLIATSVFVLALPVLASAKSALDDYVGKWNKVETNHSISITGDKGGVIDENSIKNTGEKFFEASAWTGPDKRSTLSIRGTKPGKGTVSFKYKYKGKTKTYKLKIQVVKYVCPVKMISFGDFKFKASKRSLLANMGSTYTFPYAGYPGKAIKKYKAVFSVTPAKGWKVKKIVKKGPDGKEVKVKNDTETSVNGNTTFEITMKNKKTKKLSVVSFGYAYQMNN